MRCGVPISAAARRPPATPAGPRSTMRSADGRTTNSPLSSAGGQARGVRTGVRRRFPRLRLACLGRFVSTDRYRLVRSTCRDSRHEHSADPRHFGHVIRLQTRRRQAGGPAGICHGLRYESPGARAHPPRGCHGLSYEAEGARGGCAPADRAVRHEHLAELRAGVPTNSPGRRGAAARLQRRSRRTPRLRSTGIRRRQDDLCAGARGGIWTDSRVTSPTFNILHLYRARPLHDSGAHRASGCTLVHLDATASRTRIRSRN